MPMITPRDKLSRLPLPILPFESASVTSEHHAAHPSSSELLKHDGGEAVRAVRLQIVQGLGSTASRKNIKDPTKVPGEHQLYHHWFDGPELPASRREQFEYVVWATLPYVPTKAIAFPNKRPMVVKMTPEQIEAVRKNIKGEASSKATDFMQNYLLEQDLSHVGNNVIDEFVNTPDDERRYFLGHWLLAQAAEVATEPIEGRYKNARSLGRIPLNAAKLSNVVKQRFKIKRNGIPQENDIFEEMRYKLGGHRHEEDLLGLEAA